MRPPSPHIPQVRPFMHLPACTASTHALLMQHALIHTSCSLREDLSHDMHTASCHALRRCGACPDIPRPR